MAELEPEAVEVGREDGIVTVTLNRPERLNAISIPMFRELRTVFDEVAANDDDRVLVVTGAGGAFSSGADLAAEGPQQHWLAHMHMINRACLALHRVRQPTIARVDGVAVGAGLNLALACDLVVASERSRFSEIFSKRALSIDFGGSWVLPRLVGMQRAKELALLGDVIDAERAEAMGLVNRVVPVDGLDAFVDDWARRLAAGPPIAMAQTKRLLSSSFDVGLPEALDAEAAAQSVNFTTDDTAEALSAFIAKREATYRGR